MVRSTVLLGVVFVALAAGCTPGPGDPSPTTTAPVAAPPTAASASAATNSTGSMATDDELAMGALQRYYQELSRALQTRQTVDLRAAFTRACSVCLQDADTIDAARLAGRTFEGPGFSVADLRVTSRPEPTRILVRGTVSLPPLVTRDASGQVIKTSSGSSGVKDASVVRTADGWRVELLSR